MLPCVLIRELVSRDNAAITVRGKFVSAIEKDLFKCWYSENIIIQRRLCVMCTASAGRHNV